jgi:uncharacterized membrane protein YeaQ/YmgE (transglycosylase-associated protein family)
VLILGLLVWGMFAGWAAGLILGRHSMDWPDVLLAGVIGSFVGGLIGSLLMGDGLALRPSGLIGSIIGAVIFLALVDRFRLKHKRAERAAVNKAARSGRHQPG